MVVVDIKRFAQLKEDIKELTGLIEEVREFKLKLGRYTRYDYARTLFRDVLEAQLMLESKLIKCREEYAQAKNPTRSE